MLVQHKLMLWVLALLCLIWVLFRTRLFQFLDHKSNAKFRDEHLDGLRCFLALLVVFSHYPYSYAYFQGKVWSWESIAEYPVFIKMGSFGVALFFMISGYLFASVQPKSWLLFYQKRFYRIAPIFLLSSICCIVIAFYLQRNQIQTLDIQSTLNQIYLWFDLGIIGQKPTLFGFPDSYLINAGVTWTLFWEWAFYFSLPVLFLIRDKIGIIKLALAILFICIYFISLHRGFWSVLISFFTIGAVAKELAPKIVISKKGCDLGIVLAILFMFAAADDIYNMVYLPVMAILFILIAMGGDIFGLLRAKAFVRLGAASYSIYLLHGIAWFGLNKYIQLQQLTLSRTQYTVCSTAVLLLLLLVCCVTYYYIEKPCMAWGRRPSKWIKALTQDAACQR